MGLRVRVRDSEANLPLLPNVRGIGLRVWARGVWTAVEGSEVSDGALLDMKTAQARQGVRGQHSPAERQCTRGGRGRGTSERGRRMLVFREKGRVFKYKDWGSAQNV